jgi:hypothetical protein
MPDAHHCLILHFLRSYLFWQRSRATKCYSPPHIMTRGMVAQSSPPTPSPPSQRRPPAATLVVSVRVEGGREKEGGAGGGEEMDGCGREGGPLSHAPGAPPAAVAAAAATITRRRRREKSWRRETTSFQTVRSFSLFPKRVGRQQVNNKLLTSPPPFNFPILTAIVVFAPHRSNFSPPPLRRRRLLPLLFCSSSPSFSSFYSYSAAATDGHSQKKVHFDD